MLHHDFDVYQQRFYLTSKGWRETLPRNASEVVEVWELDIYQPTGWNREYHDWTCMWATPAKEWTCETRDILREKFPFPDFRKPDVRSVLNVGFPLGAGAEESTYMVA